MSAEQSPRDFARQEMERLRTEHPDILQAAEMAPLAALLDADMEVGGRWGQGDPSEDISAFAWGEWPFRAGICASKARLGWVLDITATSGSRRRPVMLSGSSVEALHREVIQHVVDEFGPAPPTVDAIRAQLILEGLVVQEGIGDELLVVVPGSDTFCVVDVERGAVDHGANALTAAPGKLVELVVSVARPLEGNREVVVGAEAAVELRRLIGHQGDLTMAMATTPCELPTVAKEADLAGYFDDRSALDAAVACVRILDRAQGRSSWARWHWDVRAGHVVWSTGSTGDDIHRIEARWHDGWSVEYRGTVRNQGPLCEGFDLGFAVQGDLADDQLGVVLGGFMADFALRCTGGRDIDDLVPCGALPSHWGGAQVFYQTTCYSSGPQGYWRVKTKTGDPRMAESLRGWHARAVAADGTPDGWWFEGGGAGPGARPMYYLGRGWRTSRNPAGVWNYDETIVQLCQRKRPPGWSVHDVETSLGLTGLGIWPQALGEVIEAENATQTTRRQGRASKRAMLSVWVPPEDAPRQARAGSLDAQGSTAGAWSAGRKRPKTPMRIVLGLWGQGFGVEAIESIASAAGEPSSKSALHRLVRQAQDPSHKLWGGAGAASVGAVECLVGDLANALQPKAGSSPVPAEGLALLAELPERSRHFLEVLEARGVLTITEAMDVFDLETPKTMGGITGAICRRARLNDCPIPYEASIVDGERRWVWRGWSLGQNDRLVP